MKYITIILFLILFNCKDREPSPKVICFSKSEKEKLVEAILNNEKVRDYLHLDVKERNPVKLKSNEFVKEDLSVEINDHKVVITSQTNLKDLVTLRLKKVLCEEKKVFFSVFFNFENASIEGEALRKKTWEVVVKKEVEF